MVGVRLDDSCVMFVYLHQREQMFTQVYAAKHRERLSSLGAQMGHCVGDETWKLCSAHRLIFCLKCVTTLELSQFHLEVWWCAFHVRWITEQFKPAFFGFKIKFFSTLHTWENDGRDLLFHSLAARKMAQVLAASASPTGAAWSWSCRLSALRWLVMSHRNAISHSIFLSRSCAVSFLLLSVNSHIFSHSSKHLFRTFPWLSRRTFVW